MRQWTLCESFETTPPRLYRNLGMALATYNVTNHWVHAFCDTWFWSREALKKDNLRSYFYD